jgi:hypothetical protein
MIAKFSFILIACAAFAYGVTEKSPFQVPVGPILKATVKINVIASESNFNPDRIMPGSIVKVGAIVKNTGDKESKPEQIYIRYAFADPLHKEPNSVLFETEKENLPAILPDHTTVITFSKTHTWPSVFDYLREDWNMREYQVVAIVDGKESVIGHSTIAVSATYSNQDGHNIQPPEESRGSGSERSEKGEDGEQPVYLQPEPNK